MNPTGRSTTRAGYEWRCPICGTSRLNASEGESGLGNAVAALRTHVIASDDAEHGPRHEYPATFDAESLADHVVRVDERRRPGRRGP